MTDLSVGLDASVTTGPIEGNALDATVAGKTSIPRAVACRDLVTAAASKIGAACSNAYRNLSNTIAVAMSRRVMVRTVVVASTGTVMSP